MPGLDSASAAPQPLLSPGVCAQVACILEATAPKVGNVNRRHDFDDLTLEDLLVSAAAIGPVLDRAPQRRVGETVLDAIRATRRVVATNTNLGLVLLLAPLATVYFDRDLSAALERCLSQSDLRDTELVFEAIRLARPGGLGRVEDEDVASAPGRPLREVMQLARGRDSIARQLSDAFDDVLHAGRRLVTEALKRCETLPEATACVHLGWMSELPDSLIARRHGMSAAQQAGQRAEAVLSAGWPASDRGQRAFVELDEWLRGATPRRNPGTSADLTAATLFLAIRDGIIEVPLERRS